MNGFRTFEEACRATVSAAEAERELQKHGSTLEEFQQRRGKKAEYKGKTVLAFLGY